LNEDSETEENENLSHPGSLPDGDLQRELQEFLESTTGMPCNVKFSPRFKNIRKNKLL